MLTKETVRRIREDMGLTQKQFADKVGVSKALVNMTEAGQKPVSRQYVQKIANATRKKIIITVNPKRV